MVKIKNFVYDKKPLQTTIWVNMNEGKAVLEHLNFFNKVISEFLTVNVKIDEERYRIQVQQGVVTVSLEDRIILEGEKCGGLYKMKEENSIRGGVSMISLEGSSSRVELQGRLQ